MPRKQNNTKKRAPRRRMVKPPRRSTAKRNPFSGLVVTGVRTLVSAMPLSKFLLPITDLFLSSIGLSDKEWTHQDGTNILTIEGVSIHGLCGMSIIRYANVLVRTPNASINTTLGKRDWVDTPFTDAKLISISITATPDNKIQSRAGRWSICFVPFRDPKDETSLKNTYSPLPLARIQEMAGSISDESSKPLQLVFKPKAEDGLIYQFNPIDTSFGAIIISYDDSIRTTYHEFTADEFAPNISIRATIKLRQPVFASQATVGFEDMVFSPEYPANVKVTNGDKGPKWKLFSDASFSCTKSSAYKGQCKMVGFGAVKSIPSLDQMSLD